MSKLERLLRELSTEGRITTIEAIALVALFDWFYAQHPQGAETRTSFTMDYGTRVERALFDLTLPEEK
jgi:hypothetical protein